MRHGRSFASWFAIAGALLAVGGFGWGGLAGCSRERPAVATNQRTEKPPTTSADCRSCHTEIAAAWDSSHHAKAHRLVNPVADADAFQAARDFTINEIKYHVAWNGPRPELTETRPGGAPHQSTAEFVLGHTPLRQYVIPTRDGRYQMSELAFDPTRKDWFNVFGTEQRTPGEWGHWTGRGMNWNAMCAHCHLTDFRKNYDATTDTYASTWREHGVGCAQCHGDMTPEHASRGAKASGVAKAPPAPELRQRAQETCAPCHARNELLTGEIQPGVRYADHYRLSLPAEPGLFYADGQMKDEVFNATSIALSRMGGKAGVTCLDCHDPHSGKTILPVENNALCLQCHGGTGRQNAPPVDPTAHSHHPAPSTGNRCISCHMPTTTYMQRDPRHDHGFLRPDPLLTKELGIPNACNGCHTDQNVDWAIARTNEWYGSKMESRQRERTRVVSAAQSLAPAAGDKLLALLAGEDIPAWRATLLLLARPYAATHPRLAAAARTALADADPLVRSAAVQVLAPLPDSAAAIRPLLKDPMRLVRVDAESVLTNELPAESVERKELDAYHAVAADQPAGRVRIAQDLFNRGRAADAEPVLRKAVEWDPNSPGIYESLGLVLNALDRSADSAAAFWRAAQLNPGDADPAFNAALAFAGSGKLPDAELALRETIRRDPRHHRAWYNLGLLLAQTKKAGEALEVLGRAETLAPQVADYPYARATVLWQRGDRGGASAAARRVLELDPAHPRARALLQQ